MDDVELEEMARVLESSGAYRVLRRLRPGQTLAAVDGGAETLLGIFLDVETTGLDLIRDEVIELAMLPFRYTRDGHVCEVLEPMVGYASPLSRSRPRSRP
jgi:DNA polymerase III subunit epsilon